MGSVANDAPASGTSATPPTELGTPPTTDGPSDMPGASARLDAAVAREAGQRRRSNARRLAALAMILLTGIVIARALDRPPTAPVPAPGGRVFFVDVEGWYRRSSDEVAVRSPIDLTLDALPASLPHDLGPWRGFDRPHDPAVDRWLRHPEVVVERTYTRADGEVVWLSAFGSRGPKSFRLFEHTPDTCYPLGGWVIERFTRTHLPYGPQPLTVNHGVASGAEGRLVFLYFYVWDTPARDADRGVLSVRIAAPVRRDDAATLAVLAADFLPQLFPTTLSWVRF
jgi:hypothetical protein